MNEKKTYQQIQDSRRKKIADWNLFHLDKTLRSKEWNNVEETAAAAAILSTLVFQGHVTCTSRSEKSRGKRWCEKISKFAPCSDGAVSLSRAFAESVEIILIILLFVKKDFECCLGPKAAYSQWKLPRKVFTRLIIIPLGVHYAF